MANLLFTIYSVQIQIIFENRLSGWLLKDPCRNLFNTDWFILISRQQHSADDRQHATLSDGHPTEQLVQLLVVAHCQLQITGNDTSVLIVAGSVTSQLQDLSSQVGYSSTAARIKLVAKLRSTYLLWRSSLCTLPTGKTALDFDLSFPLSLIVLAQGSCFHAIRKKRNKTAVEREYVYRRAFWLAEMCIEVANQSSENAVPPCVT